MVIAIVAGVILLLVGVCGVGLLAIGWTTYRTLEVPAQPMIAPLPAEMDEPAPPEEPAPPAEVPQTPE